MPNSKCDIRLVNDYGDGHNHELAQFREAGEIISRIAETTNKKMYFLGNVVVGNSSLDALLIGEFGFIIFEFKSYRMNGFVDIDGQNRFNCFDNAGNPVLDENGHPLVVKGGTFQNPIEQAKANRRNVSEYLKKYFGEANNFNSACMEVILFPGSTQIKGHSNIDNTVSRWLTVVNVKDLENCLKSIFNVRQTGISDSQIQSFITKLGATTNCQENVDMFKLASDFYNQENYNEALRAIRKCSANREDVRRLKLNILYRKGDSNEFSQEVTLALQSNNNGLRLVAKVMLGQVFQGGSNGYPCDLNKALSYFDQALKDSALRDRSLSPQIRESILRSIEDIKRKITENEQRKSEEETFKQVQDKRRELDQAKSGCKYATKKIFSSASRLSRAVLKTVLLACIISVFIPYNWALCSGVISVLGIIVLLAMLGFDIWDLDGKWAIPDDPQPYYSELEFDEIEVVEDDKNEIWMQLKAMAAGMLHIVLAGVMFYIMLLLSFKILHFSFLQKIIQFIYSLSDMNIATLIIIFMVVGFLIVIIPFLVALLKSVFDESERITVNHWGDKTYYIGYPKFFDGYTPLWQTARSIAVGALIIGVEFSVTVCLVSTVKPVIIGIFSWLIGVSHEFTL